MLATTELEAVLTSAVLTISAAGVGDAQVSTLAPNEAVRRRVVTRNAETAASAVSEAQTAEE